MQIHRIKLSTLTYLLVSLTVLGYLMVIGRGILIPIVAGIFFSMILYPMAQWFEGLLKNRIIGILLSELLVIGVVLGVFYFFSQQISPFLVELERLREVIPNLIDAVIQWVSGTFNLDPETAKSWTKTVSARAFDYLAGSVNIPSILLTTIGLLPIYSFLLLLYRSAFRQFFLIQVNQANRDKVNQFLRQVMKIAQGYIYGLGIVILILAILNSAGLWLIGLPYPILWGLLAAFLAIIPYVGTFIGGLLPFLYALLNLGTVWQPVMVVVLYASVQQLEGNVITPRVIGSKVKLNPLAAIVALFVFGAIWGLIGLILALPIMGIIRLMLTHVTSMQPVAYLLGSNIGHGDDQLLETYNDERFQMLKRLFYH